jgi:hypothetical protein
MAGGDEGLTAAQRASAQLVCQEWVGHGLSLQPADRATAQAGVGLVYQAAGLPPPRRLVWVGSPLAGLVAALALTAGSDPSLRVEPQVWNRAWARLAADAAMPAGDPVWAHLEHDQVGAPLWSRLREPVWDAWWAACAQVGEPVWEEAAAHAAGVDARVGGVGEAIWQQVSGQLAEAEVGWQVREALGRHARGLDGAWEWDLESRSRLLAKVARRAWLPPWELAVGPPAASGDAWEGWWPGEVEDDPDAAPPGQLAGEFGDLSPMDQQIMNEESWEDELYWDSLGGPCSWRSCDPAGTCVASMTPVRWRSSTCWTAPSACTQLSRSLGS